MGKVNVVIVDATGNKEQKVGLPDDIKCGIIMVKLVEKIKLPSVGPDGNPISYKFIHKVTGRQLLEAQTLSEAGIKDGDVLRLQPEITAGAKKRISMVRILAICLSLVSILTMVACGENERIPEDTSDVSQTIETAEESKNTESEVPTLKVGQTAKTDMLELTLKNVQYADKVGLDSDNWLKPTSFSGGIGPGEGNVFVWFEYDVKNVTNEEIEGYYACGSGVWYQKQDFCTNGTYTDGRYGWSTKQGLSRNVGVTSIKPHETQHFYGYIPCSAGAKTDPNASVDLIIALPSTSGDANFLFEIK